LGLSASRRIGPGRALPIAANPSRGRVFEAAPGGLSPRRIATAEEDMEESKTYMMALCKRFAVPNSCFG